MGRTRVNAHAFRGRRHMRDNDGDDDVFMDIEDTGPSSDDTKVFTGPLSRWPSWDYAGPALLVYALFITMSVLYWQTSLRDLLWISGESFFSEKQFWRGITSIAVHADAVHLLSNTPLFIIFGWLLHAYFGKALFPAASLMAGVISAVMTVWIYEPNVRLVGASGMVYGMAALWLVFFIRYDSDRRVPVRIIRAIGFALVILAPTVYNPSTSYLAHAIGFLAGSVIAVALLPFIRPRREFRERPAEEIAE